MKTRLQVLLPPPGREAFSGIQTFSGLCNEDKKRLFEICKFQYMGNFDYEDGVSPKVMLSIASNRKEYLFLEKKIKGKIVYFFIKQEDLEEYSQKVEKLAENDDSHEYHGLKSILTNEYSGEERNRPQGWIDIDRIIMFFINEEMAKNFNEFLSIE